VDKFNILDHELVPGHRIMEEEEIEQVLETYSITKVDLPKIKKSDPISKKLEAKAGDVLCIIRKSQTAGESTVYRFVIG